MKTIIPKSNPEKDNKFLLLENYTDMGIFFDYIEGNFKTEIDLYRKYSKLELENKKKTISHTWWKTPVGLATATIASMFDFNELIQASGLMSIYKKSIQDDISKHNRCIINKVGGIYPAECFNEDTWIFIEEEQVNYKIFSQNSIILNSEKCLILENDPALDKWTIEKMRKDESFSNASYIINLRDVLADEDIFEKTIRRYKFDKIFVYTTGLDYEQMIDYTTRAIKCGIKKFEFIFNGKSANIMNFIIWSKTYKQIEFKIEMI